MKIKFLTLVMCLMFFILSIGIVFADFELVSKSIQTSYGQDDFVKGWFSMNFENEEGNSVFVGSEGGSITLSELLILNKQTSACDFDGCISDYSPGVASTTKTIILDAGEKKVIGLKFSGDIEDILSLDFNISSNATASCDNQIEVDLFGEINLVNTKASTELCGAKSYGCFQQGHLTENFILSGNPYCQKIKLDRAPGFELGSYVSGDGSLYQFEMSLWNGDQKQKYCSLQDISSNGEFSCGVNFSILSSGDYYVCVNSLSGQAYSTLGYNEAGSCGFYGSPVKDGVAAYKIFAQPLMFDDVGDLDLPQVGSLMASVENYLKQTYGDDMDCGSIDCIVPIILKANSAQTITLSDLSGSYDTITGPKSISNFYDLIEIPSLVNGDNLKLFLDKVNFSIPDDFGTSIFTLDFDGNELFSESIAVEESANIISLSPSVIMAGYPTEFVVAVDAFGKNITEYKWDFGNNDSLTTTKNTVIYSYGILGNYNLEVTITEEGGRVSSRIFEVEITSPEEAIEGLISKKIEDLAKVKTDIQGFPLFYQDFLNNLLNLNEAEILLEDIQKSYASASTDEDYINVIASLFDITIPESLFISQSADSIAFFNSENEIDVSFVKGLVDRGDCGSQENCVNSILGWGQENLDMSLNFKEISVTSEIGTELLASFVELSFNKKENFDYPFFVMVENLENIGFDSGEFELQDKYHYAEISDTMKITWATTEQIDFVDLPVFVSPEIMRLAQKTEPVEVTKVSKWLYFILILLVLVILFFFGYIYLQIWYKKKYEKYLFKNENDLYNMISFVQNSKKKQIQDVEIMKRLKKAGWSNEQTNYVMKKYSGKRTGMAEFSFGKISSLFKKKEKIIPKRNNIRFQNRSRF